MSFFSKVQEDFFNQKQVVFIDHFFKNIDTKNLGKNKEQAFTLLLCCEELGFSFDSKLLNVASNATEKELDKFFKWFKEETKNIYRQSSYKPMYPNFPKEVIKADELDLLVNAFMHYTGDLFGLRILPKYKEKSRKELKEEVNPIRLSVATKEDIENTFVNILTSNTSLSLSNKDMLKNIFNYLNETAKEFVEDVLQNKEIPQKENIAFVGALVSNSELDFGGFVNKHIKTPTDLLRLSAALNDGDTSLAVNTKVKKMSRKVRRTFANKIEDLFKNGDSSQFLENMFTYKEQWTRLAYAMHIGEYKDKCPLAFEALQKVRNNEKEESFNFSVEKLLSAGETLKASDLLLTRPGVFGRMLNQVLLKTKEEELMGVLNRFHSAAKSIATPVLLQIHAKFKYDNQADKKIILPKGGLGKVFVKENSEEESKKVVSDLIAKTIVDLIETTLVERFQNGESLGNVYIEDSLALQNVPFAQRTASKALKTVPKGSRFKKDSDKPIIRFFTWWNETGIDKEGKEVNVDRVDIDLSVGIFDSNYNLLRTCSYYDLRSFDYMVHSGDITSAPEGAAEYIDVHLDRLQKDMPKAAFVGQLISAYTQQKYSDIPECYAGWMEREKLQAGKIFEPSTVKNKVDITCDFNQVLVCLYDIAKKEYIWADTPMVGNYYCNNLHSVKNAMAYTIEGIVEMKKANLYDLFSLHTKARGVLVEDKNKADTIFSLNEGITPFDSEVIASQFMANEYEKKDLSLKAKM